MDYSERRRIRTADLTNDGRRAAAGAEEWGGERTTAGDGENEADVRHRSGSASRRREAPPLSECASGG